MYSKYSTQILLSLLAVFAIGCQRQTQVVWVNWRLAVSSSESNVAQFSPPLGGTLSPSSDALPTKPASNRGKGETTQRRADALSLMQKEREQIRNSLEIAYRSEYLLNVTDYMHQLRTELQAQLRDAADGALETISSWVYKHAMNRSDNVVRMALIRGYPVQRRISDKENVLRRSIYESQLETEWNRLRDELTEIDNAFATKLNDYLSDNLRLGTELQSRLTQSIEAELKRADEVARKKSEERLSQTSRLAIPILLDSSAGQLPPLPAQVSTIPGAKADFYSVKDSFTPRGNEAEVFQKLNIWLSLQGYKLSRSPKGVSDFTAEFMNWLKNN